jgi:glycosyltransferase involved in cell wall biosynthesis
VQRRLTVGVIVNTFEQQTGRSGGVVHLLESVKRWKECDVTFFAPASAQDMFLSEVPEARFVTIPSPDRWLKSIAALFAVRIFTSLLRLGRLRRLDAIYAYSHFLPDIVPAVCAAPRRTAVQVFHLQDPPGKRPGTFVRNVIAYANELLGMALVRGFARSVIVLNHVTVPQLKLPGAVRIFRAGAGAWPMPVQNLIQPEDRRAGVVSVGRVHPTKGIDDLIEAWSALHAWLPQVQLTVVGTGDPAYIASLRQRIAERGLESSICLAGFVPEREKMQILSGSRVYVTASKEEGWGIAVAEAMALGVPCVTYDLPVFAEAFPSGRLEVKAGDVKGLTEALIALLTDDARYKKLAKEAHTLGASFSWDSVARIEEDAIASVARVQEHAVASTAPNA